MIFLIIIFLKLYLLNHYYDDGGGRGVQKVAECGVSGVRECDG